MRRRKYYKIKTRRKKRGQGLPYIFKNRVRQVLETGNRAVSGVIARLLENVIGL